MNRIRGRTAVITGATAGIGRACGVALVEHGVNVVLVARRADRLAQLEATLSEGSQVAVHTHVLDVRDRAGVGAFATRLAEDGIEVDILVNNAGLARGLDTIQDGRPEDWQEMIDTNVMGVLHVSRALLPSMIARNRGHVINIGSIAGHVVYPRGNVYNATKFAVRALTEAMSIDLVGTMVRVSSVDPGLVETEFSEVRFRGDTERAEKVYKGLTPLTPDDIAESVCFVANMPEHVNVLDLVVMPTDQRTPYVIAREDA